MVQNGELPLRRRVPPLRRRRELFLHWFAPLSKFLDQSAQVLLGKLRHAFQECKLIVEVVVGAVEPKPGTDGAVNSERAADGIAEVAVLKLIVFREDLDSLRDASAFHWNTELLSQTRDQQPALPGQKRLLPEDPQVRATSALFQCRFHLLLLQLPLQFADV